MNKIEKEIIKNYKYTDTRYGTDSAYEFSSGNCLPLLGPPRAANYFAVQTRAKGGSWWFNPQDDNFEGFRLTHQPSPWMGDYSYLTILPYSKSQKISYYREKSIFNPAFNIIRYTDGTRAKISGDLYSGIIDYKAQSHVSFLIQAPDLTIRKRDGLLEGWVKNCYASEDPDFTMYFIISIDCDFRLEDDKDCFIIQAEEKRATLSISTSFISLDQAKVNHERFPKDYKSVLKNAKKAWDEIFDKVDISIDEVDPLYEKYNPYNKKDQRKFFYHCLYRASLFPMRFYEIDQDNKEIHYDTTSKKAKPGKAFTNIGFWDGQKTLFPLLTLIDRAFLEEVMEGLVNFYKDTGFLPKWLSPDERSMMPGTLVDNVIADLLSKGIGLVHGETLLEAMINSANPASDTSKYGRFGAKIMDDLGYIPDDFHESVNQTLDNSLSDFSIGKVAEILGKNDISRKYYDKSKSYKNLFDKESGWFRAKDREGNFAADFDPYKWGSPYTEGSAFQNSFNAYHDIGGLVELFGSQKAFEAKLDGIANSDSNFDVGAYGQVIHEMREVEVAHFGQIGISNQPSFHLPYLYNYVDRPDKTQLLVKELMLNYFNPSFRAFPGDEDNGSLSSWFILSSMGIYPVAPGTGNYELGIPFYDEITIKLSNDKTLRIKTQENFHHKKFVKEVKIDGEIYKKTRISHDDFIKVNEIIFTLGLVPERRD